MNTLNSEPTVREAIRPRAIAYRTLGREHGPVTRLMSPGDLGQVLKPFVFLDRIDIDPSQHKGPSFGLHPHSGIATLTWLYEGKANFEDTTGRRGEFAHHSMEWMHAGKGAWHGGSFGDAGRLRGFQLWVALPEAAELSAAYSRYIGPDELATQGPVTVLLGEHGSARGRVRASAPVNYFSVSLKANERWTYEPPSGHTVAWAAVSAGRLRLPQAIETGELVAFEEGRASIEFVAAEATEFVFGSAVKHPHELALGYYSVHTNDKALQQGEAWIRELGRSLRAQGRL